MGGTDEGLQEKYQVLIRQGVLEKIRNLFKEKTRTRKLYTELESIKNWWNWEKKQACWLAGTEDQGIRRTKGIAWAKRNTLILIKKITRRRKLAY